MFSMTFFAHDRSRFRPIGVLPFLFTVTAVLPIHSLDMVLEPEGTYISQPAEPDHLLDVLALGDGRAIVSGNKGMALLDIEALPVAGTYDYLFRLTTVNARGMVIDDNGVLYVNLGQGNPFLSHGFAVVRLVGNTLEYLRSVDELDVFYEKLCLPGDGYLYVPAHSYGIRIFDLSDPLNPVLVGTLDSGFVDATAMAVVGDTAYVADGGGGLKLVDVSVKSDPWLIAGETLATAQGTSEDVCVRNGRVFVAAGGAGIAVYQGGSLSERTLYPVNQSAEDLSWIGDHLVVADRHGILVYDVDEGGALSLVAHEIMARRGAAARVRICGAADSDDDVVLCANWDYLDAYRLLLFSQGSSPDISPSIQRIRFAPEADSATVTLYNQGAADLLIDQVSSTSPAFQSTYGGGTIVPGDSVDVRVLYDGSANATGTLRFSSNDPDENPLPIQLFGDTQFLDPGEPAVDFRIPLVSKDASGDYVSEMFTLSDQLGKVVWFQVYASW